MTDIIPHITVDMITGHVVNVTVGLAPVRPGQESIPRVGAAENSAIGSVRQPDGSYLPPPDDEVVDILDGEYQ